MRKLLWIKFLVTFIWLVNSFFPFDNTLLAQEKRNNLPQKSRNTTILYKMASAEALRGNYDEAVKLFENLIKVSPYYSLPRYGLGKLYLYGSGRIKDAIKELKLATKYDRKYAPAYFYLGIALMFDKKYTHAIHAFNKAYKYDNDNLEALYNIGTVFEIMDDNFNAQRYYNIYYKQLDLKKNIKENK